MGASHLSALVRQVVSVNPPNFAAANARGSVDVTVPGIAVGDVIVGLEIPDALEDDLVLQGWLVTAANTVRLWFYSTAIQDPAARNWNITFWDLT